MTVKRKRFMSEENLPELLDRIQQKAQFDLDLRKFLRGVFLGLGGIEEAAAMMVEDIKSLPQGSSNRVGLWKLLLTLMGAHGQPDRRGDDEFLTEEMIDKEMELTKRAMRYAESEVQSPGS